MAGCRRSGRFVAGFAAVAVLVLSWNAAAQPPGSQPGSPPGSPSLGPPSPMPAPPPAPGIPSAVPIIPPQPGVPGVQRFNFRIAPNTPVKDLLPTTPKAATARDPVLSDDLAKVPEAEFQAKPEKGTASGKLTEQTAHQLAKINHLNAKKADAFMAALLENRADLAGLPFVMGDDCRTSGERSRQFSIAVNTVRQALGGRSINAPNAPDVRVLSATAQPNQGGGLTITAFSPQTADVIQGSVLTLQQPFWNQYRDLCEAEDAARGRTDKKLAEHVTLARVAALMQMLAPESAEMRLGLVKYLTGVPHVEATKALARLAIYSAEDDVRLAAIDSLKVRREKDYTDVLVKGLRYPWPAVAKRSADAITRLGRADLVPELVAVLDETDPRLPLEREKGGKKAAVVREMVRVNHHRNCMMCHAPGNPEKMSESAITAEVPVQTQPLPTPAQGYRQSSPDLMVRIDVTYLRQDFSAMLEVADAHPWPEMQRFDFLVRERVLTDDEAALFRDKLTPKEAGVPSPYHKAALAALRELTGKDAAPTAAAWRKLLDLTVKD